MVMLDNPRETVTFERSSSPFCLYACFHKTKYEKGGGKKRENCTISPIFPGKTAGTENWCVLFWSTCCLVSFCECRRTPPARSYETSSCCPSDPTVRISPGPETQKIRRGWVKGANGQVSALLGFTLPRLYDGINTHQSVNKCGDVMRLGFFSERCWHYDYRWFWWSRR